MAYGGGTWLAQNKILPGAYINFSSVSKASATLSDRGIAAAPFELDWGAPGVLRLIEQGEFQKESFELFGHGYTDDEMLPLREIFLHATKVYCYRLDGEGAVKASCDFATAKYVGTRGNDIRIVVEADADVSSGYIVKTMVGSKVIDEQKVTDFAKLKDNDWIDFKAGCVLGTKPSEAGGDSTVYVAAGTYPLTGGNNGTVNGEAHQNFLDAIESCSFNTLCCPVADDDTVKSLYVAFTKRVRDKLGSKFQLVGYDLSNPDYMGVINLKNSCNHPKIANVNKASLVYWLTGAEAACNINRSLTNTAYDGELEIVIKGVTETQAQLEDAMKSGMLAFHKSNGKIVILEDINSFVTLEENLGDIFQMNQTVRVCDQIANDIAVLFVTRYLGIVQNDATGRASLWNDIVYYLKELLRLRAIENLDTDKVTVELGRNKKTVLVNINNLSVVNAMSQLYMAVVIE